MYSLAEAACRAGGKRGKSYRLPQAQPNTGKHSQDTGRHRYSTGLAVPKRKCESGMLTQPKGSVGQWFVQERKLKEKSRGEM